MPSPVGHLLGGAIVGQAIAPSALLLCAMAGVPYDNAQAMGRVQSLSTLFKVANVDVARAASVPKRMSDACWRLL